MNEGLVLGQQQCALLTVDGAVATITLNRPGAYNSIDIDMAQRLSSLALQVEQMPGVHVLIIRGAGKAFCAGGDINFFIEHAANLRPPITELLTQLNTFLVTLKRMPALVITSVQGVAAGAGFSMAFMGDYCIAATSARFRPAYAALGVSPDAGGSYALVQGLGARRALAVLLQEEINCQHALALGLVSQEAEDAQIEHDTLALAHRLAQLNPQALASTKKLAWHVAGAAMAQQLDAELEEMLKCMATTRFQDNIRRFARARDNTKGR
ncbi:enoyl-CoA hydratase/isomerase family protein [Pseudomonas typographi]|uniref:Enoyl-CoA hydratase/isomerase family protein n=1 Tax=Pseudomonas typographi TaxID=2715964 RepID=A0ABR7Z1R8_9PSED|nr:enoyl-CoA hydratase/isomerase family protein [Pseudomonas typographi]MBD1551525.1 enoyl-CoA hydratase/isomerase family protein [Pseudomonas typographi]MBD1599428.1 enoyl-CoA hydratase/isomerase family protein [Pseudomonas typographi]